MVEISKFQRAKFFSILNLNYDIESKFYFFLNCNKTSLPTNLVFFGNLLQVMRSNMESCHNVVAKYT